MPRCVTCERLAPSNSVRTLSALGWLITVAGWWQCETCRPPRVTPNVRDTAVPPVPPPLVDEQEGE